MLASTPPGKIPVPFANAGIKNDIPVNSQISTAPGRASLETGFPPLNFTPVEAGGIPPFGADMNGILNEMSDIQRWQCAGGSFTFDAAFAALIGGYPAGSVLLRADGTGFWLNRTDNNSTNPDTGGAGWVPAFNYGITSIAVTSASVTLTASQAGRGIIVLTGAPASNRVVNFPALTVQWLVINNTTGNAGVTLKTASGTGVMAPKGPITVWGDGVNLYSGNEVVDETGVLRFPDGETQNSVLPPAAARANRILAFDSVGAVNVINAPSSTIAWSNVTGTPTTVAGYGITDMGSQSVNYANSAGYAGTAGSASYADSAGSANSANTAATAGNANALGGRAAGDFIWSSAGGVTDIGLVSPFVAGMNASGVSYVWNVTISDERLKKNIAQTEVDSLAIFADEVEVIQYEFRDDVLPIPIADAKRDVGVSAQQLLRIRPVWVNEGGTYLQPNIPEITYSLMHAVGQLGRNARADRSRIDELESNVAALMGRIEALESKS